MARHIRENSRLARAWSAPPRALLELEVLACLPPLFTCNCPSGHRLWHYQPPPPKENLVALQTTDSVRHCGSWWLISQSGYGMEGNGIWGGSQAGRRWSWEWPIWGGTRYFKVNNIMCPKLGQPWHWNYGSSCLLPLPQWATHLASGCSHLDRGHLATHGECNQMEGAFPTQLPKAHANHLESLKHDCSSWGGWGSTLKGAGELRNLCSSVKRTGLWHQPEV